MNNGAQCVVKLTRLNAKFALPTPTKTPWAATKLTLKHSAPAMIKKQNFWKRLSTASRFLFNRGYDAARNSPRRGRRTQTQVVPESVEFDASSRQRVVATLLDFRRNNSLVKSICRLREGDVVGQGIQPQAQTGSGELDSILEREWDSYARTPEVTQTMSMREVQQQLASLPLIFGDGGLLLTRSGRVQLVEGDRIGTDKAIYPWEQANGQHVDSKRMIDGVEVNAMGRPLAYYIGRRDDNGGLVDVKRIQANNFIFHKKRMRPSQVRGIPELATICDDLQDVAEYDELEMVAAKVSATLAVAVTRENAIDFELAARADDDPAAQLQHLQVGSFQYLEPGENIEVISSNRPNSKALDYLIYRLRKIGSTLGIPVEFLLMTIGETSFSASQGMILLYQQTIENEQRSLTPALNRWWRWKVGRWLAGLDGFNGEPVYFPPDVRAAIDAREIDPYDLVWQPPGFRWINRAAQVKADSSYLQMGAISLDDVCATFGQDVETTLKRKARNIKTAKRIAEENGLSDWRELFNQNQTTSQANLIDLMDRD